MYYHYLFVGWKYVSDLWHTHKTHTLIICRQLVNLAPIEVINKLIPGSIAALWLIAQCQPTQSSPPSPIVFPLPPPWCIRRVAEHVFHFLVRYVAIARQLSLTFCKINKQSSWPYMHWHTGTATRVSKCICVQAYTTHTHTTHTPHSHTHSRPDVLAMLQASVCGRGDKTYR